MLARHFQASQPIHFRSRCYTLAADLLRRQPWLLTKTHPPPAPTRPVHREHRPHLQPLHTSVNHPRPVILRRPAATSGRLAANRRLPAPQPLTVEVGDYHPISPLLPTSVGKHHVTVQTKGPGLGQQQGTGQSIQSQRNRRPVVSQPQPNQAEVKVIPDKQGAQQDASIKKRNQSINQDIDVN